MKAAAEVQSKVTNCNYTLRLENINNVQIKSAM